MRNTTSDLQGCYSYSNLPPRYLEIDVKPLPLENGLYLQGGAGSGKTTMAVAVAKHLIDTTYRPMLAQYNGVVGETGYFTVASVKFTTAPGLLQEYKATYSDGTRADEDTVTGRLANCDLLIVDDLGKSAPTEWAVQKLWEVVERRYGDMRPIVVTSQYSKGQLAARLSKGCPETAEAIVSRLSEMCRTVDMGNKDRRLG